MTELKPARAGGFTKMLERDVVHAARKYAKSKGVRSVRNCFRPGVNVGFPDETFLIPGGRPLFAEFKAPGKKPTPKQHYEIERLKKEGYDVVVCDSVEKFKEVLDEALLKAGV